MSHIPSELRNILDGLTFAYFGIQSAPARHVANCESQLRHCIEDLVDYYEREVYDGPEE